MFKNKISFNVVTFVAKKKVGQQFFPLLFFANVRRIKIRIRNKHPGSAKLLMIRHPPYYHYSVEQEKKARFT
jgi:hypothetical protein